MDYKITYISDTGDDRSYQAEYNKQAKVNNDNQISFSNVYCPYEWGRICKGGITYIGCTCNRNADSVI